MAAPKYDIELVPSAKWSGVPQWGQSWSSPAGVRGLGAQGAEVTVGNFEPLGLPSVHTLYFTRRTKDTVGLGGPAEGQLIARVLVGCGGGMHQLELDWRHGAVISAPMTSCNVTAVQIDGTLADEVVLGVSMAKGSAPTRATRTFHGLGTVTCVVPAHATKLNVFSDRDTGDVLVQAFDLSAFPLLARWRLSTDPQLMHDGVCLPARAYTVSAIPQVGPGQAISVQFQLDA
jgi:hypothetical protein